MNSKRGQAAAVLLAIIMGLIIVFIILMPPDKRADLLGEKPSGKTPSGIDDKDTTTTIKTVKEILLKETPGRLSYLKEDEIEKLIPSTHIYTQLEPDVIAERTYLSIKKGIFSSQTEELHFQLDDLNLVEDIYLDFNIDSYQGKLIVLLNDQELFNRETNKIKPIKLPSHLLTTDNTILFQVSSPGAAFWRTNRYDLKNIKVVADITDITAQESKHLVHINSDEAKNIEEVNLRFSLSCLPQKQGKLQVSFNDHLVFSGVPDNCEDIFHYDLSPDIVKPGDNWLSFKTEDGDYDISHIAVKIELEAPSYPAYYFELDEDLFTETGAKAECGEVDNICPDDCDEDADPDCCFAEYSTPFWCDSPTSNSGDRCVGHVDAEDCSRCSSGYEDDHGNPPEDCEELCGDDTDDFCPAGCSSNYDKDCCYEKSGSQYWCDFLPTTGIDFTCTDSVGSDNCFVCPGNYDGEDDSPSCPATDSDTEQELKKAYDVILTLEFTDDDNKEAEIYVNGHKISFDTYKVEFSRLIDSHVQPWTNSIKIVPQNSFDVKELTVELKD